MERRERAHRRDVIRQIRGDFRHGRNIERIASLGFEKSEVHDGAQCAARAASTAL